MSSKRIGWKVRDGSLLPPPTAARSVPAKRRMSRGRRSGCDRHGFVRPRSIPRTRIQIFSGGRDDHRVAVPGRGPRRSGSAPGRASRRPAVDMLACPGAPGGSSSSPASPTTASRGRSSNLELDATGPPLAAARRAPESFAPAPDDDVAGPVYEALPDRPPVAAVALLAQPAEDLSTTDGDPNLV